MLSVGSTDGIGSPWNCTVSAMKVNAWVCPLAADHDLESGSSELTVIFRVFFSKSTSVRTRKMVNCA